MKSRRRLKSWLSLLGIVALAVVAMGLSAAALLQNGGGVAIPVVPSTPSQRASSVQTSSPTPAATNSTPVPSTSTSGPPSSPDPSAFPTESGSQPTGPVVVVIGDSHSLDSEEDIWVDFAAQELGWMSVLNLSSEGRGYTVAPRSCELRVCSTFGDSLELIVAEDPDIVITFGGTADGDVPLLQPATHYFSDLREALPDADLLAVSPVTGADSWEYYLSMHADAIGSGITAVDGTMIDVGRVGLGEGNLSESSHKAIADAVVETYR